MAIVNREAAEALIQEQLVNSIFQDAPKESVFMSLARRLPDMTSNQTRVPVLDMLPTAYWVSGDTGYKTTSEAAWDKVYLTAAELAVIIPIPEAVLEDASFDIIGELTPRVREAIGKAVDQAVIFGVNRPSDWPLDIISRARQAGNNVSGSSVTYDSLLGASGVIAKVEDGGHMVTGGIASMAMRGTLRGIKDDAGHPLFISTMQGATPYALDGAPLYFPLNGGMDSSVAQLVVGDWNQAVYAIRKDMTVRILAEGVIQDPSNGNIVYNLAQQDMIAMRVVFRMGWAMPNPATALNSERIYCPFAYLEPATPATTYTLTFTVKDGSNNNLSGLYVEVDGGRKKTNSSGQAVFNLFPGTYSYKVLGGASYVNATGTKTITSSAATEAVTMTAK